MELSLSRLFHTNLHLQSFPTRRSSDLSKLRLPLSTAAATRSCSTTASATQSMSWPLLPMQVEAQLFQIGQQADRKSTRLNSSHVKISYAVFCLKRNKPM